MSKDPPVASPTISPGDQACDLHWLATISLAQCQNVMTGKKETSASPANSQWPAWDLAFALGGGPLALGMASSYSLLASLTWTPPTSFDFFKHRQNSLYTAWSTSTDMPLVRWCVDVGSSWVIWNCFCSHQLRGLSLAYGLAAWISCASFHLFCAEDPWQLHKSSLRNPTTNRYCIVSYSFQLVSGQPQLPSYTPWKRVCNAPTPKAAVSPKLWKLVPAFSEGGHKLPSKNREKYFNVYATDLCDNKNHKNLRVIRHWWSSIMRSKVYHVRTCHEHV